MSVFLEFVHSATARPQEDLFSVVYRVSPSGGAHFEDVALLDPSDTDDHVVMVAVDLGPDVKIYRYHHEGGQ